MLIQWLLGVWVQALVDSSAKPVAYMQLNQSCVAPYGISLKKHMSA